MAPRHLTIALGRILREASRYATGPESRRTVRAYIVSPMAAVLAVFLLILPQSLPAALLSAGICTVVAYPITLAFGIPCHYLLVKANVRSSIGYTFSGLALGAVVPTYVLLFSGESFSDILEFIGYELASLSMAMGAFGLLGALNGYVFWRLTRPDRRMEGKA